MPGREGVLKEVAATGRLGQRSWAGYSPESFLCFPVATRPEGAGSDPVSRGIYCAATAKVTGKTVAR